jgi:tRNA G18 (ribose-2'-O)-methylase SpoU
MYRPMLLLHNIRSAHNVGSIFRTADAANVSHIYLSGYTPRPIDSLGRVQKDIAKTALGAESTVPWSYHATPQMLLRRLHTSGVHIVGVEQHDQSIDYREYMPTGDTLYILGNEVRGMSTQMLSQCDTILEIPMHGTKESLNVSVATGIVLFQYSK